MLETPKGFFYLDHRTVDGKYNIITDTHVTPANVHDSIPYLDWLDTLTEKFGFDVERVGLDADYFTASIYKGLFDRDIYGVISYRSSRIILKAIFEKVNSNIIHKLILILILIPALKVRNLGIVQLTVTATRVCF